MVIATQKGLFRKQPYGVQISSQNALLRMLKKHTPSFPMNPHL